MGFIVEGSFPYFAPILLAQVLWGLGYTFTSGATEAWISDEIGESQAGRAFLRASQIGLLAALLGILAGMGLGSIQVNLPVQLGGAGMLLAAGLTEIARRKIVTDQFHSVAKALFFLTLLLSVGLFAFALGQSFWLVIGAYWLISVTRDIIGPVYTAWVNQRLDSKVRATVLSMSGQVDAVGQILGGPGVGIIGNVVSVRVALLVSGVILTPTLPLYQRVMKTFSNQGCVIQEKISDDA